MTTDSRTTCPVCGAYMVYISQGMTRVCEACGFKGHGSTYADYLKRVEDRHQMQREAEAEREAMDSGALQEAYVCTDCGAVYPQELIFIPVTCTSCKKGRLEYKIYRMVRKPVWYKPWTWFVRKAEFMRPGDMMSPVYDSVTVGRAT